MGEKVKLLFMYLEDQDLESSYRFLVFDIMFPLSAEMSLSVYGIPHIKKASSDYGLALNFKFGSRHHLRVFSTFLDVIDRFVDRVNSTTTIHGTPFAAGITGRVFEKTESLEGNYLEYSLKGERKTVTTSTTPIKEWRVFGKLQALRLLNPIHSLRIAFQGERHRQVQTDVQSLSHQDRFVARLEHHHKKFLGKDAWGLRWGVFGSYRRAVSAGFGPARRKDFDPYFWWSFDLGRGKTFTPGIEYTRYDLAGSNLAINRRTRAARINFRYDILYLSGKSHLGFLASFSLPVGTGDFTWAGGNFHYRLLF